jgi:hypothetical protein
MAALVTAIHVFSVARFEKRTTGTKPGTATGEVGTHGAVPS